MTPHTLTVTAPVALASGCCDAPFVKRGPDTAECPACGDMFAVAHDITRHMDPGERLVWIEDTNETRFTVEILAYFTEETACPDDCEEH